MHSILTRHISKEEALHEVSSTGSGHRLVSQETALVEAENVPQTPIRLKVQTQ